MENQLRAFLLWAGVFGLIVLALALMFCAGLTGHFPGAEACNQLLDFVRQVRNALGLL